MKKAEGNWNQRKDAMENGEGDELLVARRAGGNTDPPTTFYRSYILPTKGAAPTGAEPASFIQALVHSCTRGAQRGATAGI